MKNAIMKLGFMALVFLISNTMPAQSILQLDLVDQSGNCGDIICVPVTVSNFERINSIGGSFSWDPTKLNYKEFKLDILPGFNPLANLNTSLIADGLVSFAWVDMSGSGSVTLEESEVLAELCFEVVASMSLTEAVIDQSDEPTLFFASQAPLTPLEPSIELDIVVYSATNFIGTGCSTSLVCNNIVNVSLDPATCIAVLTPDMILEGGPYAYEAMIVHPSFLDNSSLGEQVTVEVIDTVLNNACWAFVNVEDLTGSCLPVAYDQVNIFLEGQSSVPVTPAMVLYPNWNPAEFIMTPTSVDTSDIGTVDFFVEKLQKDN